MQNELGGGQRQKQEVAEMGEKRKGRAWGTVQKTKKNKIIV